MDENHTIQVHDKRFRLFISEEEISREVSRIAGEMNRDSNTAKRVSTDMGLFLIEPSGWDASTWMKTKVHPGQ